jgi:hypothetical protein
MDSDEYEDSLDEEQAYFDRMDETRKDLELSLTQHELDRNLEKSLLEHKAMEREDEARRQQLEGDDTLEHDIENRRQMILDMLRKSDLPFFPKANWINRLSSENWKLELKPLRSEIAASDVSLLEKSLSTLEDKLKDLDFMVEYGVRLIEDEDE